MLTIDLQTMSLIWTDWRSLPKRIYLRPVGRLRKITQRLCAVISTRRFIAFPRPLRRFIELGPIAPTTGVDTSLRKPARVV